MWTFLRLGWAIILQIFYLIIVFVVFTQLHERLETLMFALFGLLYTAMRGSILHQNVTTLNLWKGLGGNLEGLKSAVIPGYVFDHATMERVDQALTKGYAFVAIESIGLSLVSFFCLYQIFITLSAGS